MTGAGARGEILADVLERVRVAWGESAADLSGRLGRGEPLQAFSSIDEAAAFGGRPCRLAFCGETREAREELEARLRKDAAKVAQEGAEKLLRRQGVWLSSSPPAGKVGFLYPGQGSQSVGMLAGLRGRCEGFDDAVARADRVMAPLAGASFSELVWPPPAETDAGKEALEERLKQTVVTQPVMLAADVAMTALLARLGLRPDMAAGHSLGEYAALVAAGVLPFEDALEIVAARAREMTAVSGEDTGMMIAVAADPERVAAAIARVDPSLVAANKNSRRQTVVAGPTAAVTRALEELGAEGLRVLPLKVSHAFHSPIVAGAVEPFRAVLRGRRFGRAAFPVFANATGDAYPADAGEETYVKLLGDQIASPVEFVRCVEGMRGAGARFFVEAGPRRVLAALADDILPPGEGQAVCANNQRQGDVESLGHLFAAAAVAGAVRAR